MTTKYLLTFRPYVEILAVTSPSSSPSATPLVVPRASWPSSSLYQGASETDIIGLVSTLSAEACQTIREWHRNMLQSKTSTMLLLLSTSGLIVYLLHRRRSSSSDAAARTPDASRPRRRRQQCRPRWSSRDWLWWIFGDEDLLDSFHEDSVIVEGQFLEPPESKDNSCLERRSLNLSMNKTVLPLPLGPCPNCLLGNCRIRKHNRNNSFGGPLYNAASTSSSSYSNSPMHKAAAQGSLPPTSTPESADDEASDVEYSAKILTARAEKFRSRFFRPELDVRFKGDGSDTGESPLLLGGRSKPLPKRGHHSNNNNNVSTAKLYTAAQRVPPIGQEIWSPTSAAAGGVGEPSVVSHPSCGDCNCTDPLCLSSVLIPRDESVDSIVGVTGSMMDLVRGAREIRRLIREASFDSIASEFSLDVPLNDEVGGSTEFHFSELQAELAELKRNCSVMDDKFDRIPLSGPSSMVSSRSEYGLSTSPASSSCCESRRSRTPDLQLLQKPRRHFWKMTNYNVSDVESPIHSSVAAAASSAGEESMEWDSPMHGWHDLRKPKYKFALSSSRGTSECGDEDRSIVTTHDGLDPWEWDSDGMLAAPEVDCCWGEMSMLHHQKWLPESTENFELDLEAELTSRGCYSGSGSGSTTATSSRRDSLDRSSSFTNRIRLPPSGRSSVDRGSGDTPKQNIDHEALVKSFGVPRSSWQDQLGAKTNAMTVSAVSSSDESGFQETSSTSSMFVSSVLTLSPVHEAKEPGSATATPIRKQDVDKCSKVLFQSNDDERLIVFVDPK